MQNNSCSKGKKLGTNDQILKFNNLMQFAKKEKYSIVKVLEMIQDIYGYLPEVVLKEYSSLLNVPLSDIYGVATFYAQFSLVPKGKYVISVCTGTACYVNGGENILDKFCTLLNIKPGECTPDGKFSIDQTRCLGCCGIAPVVTVNDKVYKSVKISEVEKILSEYTKETN